MDGEWILCCEDSLEGIFTAIYDAFVHKNRMEGAYADNIRIAVGEGENCTLFAVMIEVQTDEAKVYKTVKAIQTRLGFAVYDTLLSALCHFAPDRASAVLGYLVRAFAKGRDVSDHLADPYVMRVMELSRKVRTECDKFYGFLRFREHGDVLLAEIEPKCNLVPLMMEHFADRFPGENFIIYDSRRKLAAVHEAYHACVLTAGLTLEAGKGEDYTEALWKQYVTSMEIKERHNERCQRTMMPLWYRKHMVEHEAARPVR